MQTHLDRKRTSPLVRGIIVCLVLLFGALLWMYKTIPQPTSAPVEEAASVEPAPVNDRPAAALPLGADAFPSLEQQWGIQVSSISLTNGNTTVQVRYTVVAPEKTVLLTETNAEVYLLNQATGAKLGMFTPPQSANEPTGVPKRTVRRIVKQAGELPPPPTRVLAGRAYSLLIPNWDQALQSGSRVALVVGNARTENVIVE